MMHSFSLYGSFLSIFYMAIPFVLGYIVIRLAVRHAIDSSEVGRILIEKSKNEKGK